MKRNNDDDYLIMSVLSLIVGVFGPFTIVAIGIAAKWGVAKTLGVLLLLLVVWLCVLANFFLGESCYKQHVSLRNMTDTEGTEEILSILGNKNLNWKFDKNTVFLKSEKGGTLISFTNNFYSDIDNIVMETPLMKVHYSKGCAVFVQARELCNFLFNEHIADLTSVVGFSNMISINENKAAMRLGDKQWT